MKLGELTYKYGNHVSKKYDLFPCEPVERVGLIKRAAALIECLIFGNKTQTQEAKIPLSTPKSESRSNK
jgi:hypothetical protein